MIEYFIVQSNREFSFLFIGIILGFLLDISFRLFSGKYHKEKKYKYRNIKKVSTIKVPIEAKFKRRDGSIVIFKAKKIIKCPRKKKK